ncbi:hypothetical protein LINPERPRIM_LOCUS16899 [Linum perenne]
MGCLLGCLGIASRRRGRKLPTRILPRDHGLGSYEQLHSSGSADFVSTTLDSEQRKLKETLNSKIRKKVRFNLNVEAYEPIPSDSFYQGDDEEDDEPHENGGKTLDSSSPTTDMASYPSNYRYRNCIYSYDEEEEDEEDLYDDYSDLDSDEDLYDEEEAEDDQHNDIEELRRRTTKTIGTEEEEVSQHFSSLKVCPNSSIDPKERRSRWPEIMNHQPNAQEKNQYTHSVLNPVENLAQWKEVKAQSKQQPEKRQMKENTEVQLIPEAYNASSSSRTGCGFELGKLVSLSSNLSNQKWD